MGRWIVWASMACLAGCASGQGGGADAASTGEIDACRRSVDAGFSASLVAPERSSAGLCNVNGGMTPCRGPATASLVGKATFKPLTSHEEDSQRLLAACLVAQRTAR